MQRLMYRPKRGMTRILALSLALVCFLFLLHVAPHGHANGQDEAACRICQAAHVSATPVVSGIVFAVPFFPVGEITQPQAVSASDSFFHHSDPRAPPASEIL
jgi:hypothetical protein